MWNKTIQHDVKFSVSTGVTAITQLFQLVLGVLASIGLARLLGPEGKGIYTLAALLPTLVVIFANLGIGPATVYYVAQGRYPRREILGNNILLALGISTLGIIGGLILTLFFHQDLFPGVAQGYLLLALALIPVNLLFAYMQSILLGVQKFKEFNLIVVIYSVLFLSFLGVTLWALKAGITGAILANVLARLLADMVLFFWLWNGAGGISFKLNRTYIKRVFTYGIQAHLGNVLGFLNYRIDIFLVNSFLDPIAVGFYSISVGLVEKLWLVSRAASTVLFPRVVAENDEKRRKAFTPLVARTVLWLTVLEALVFFLASRWLVKFLYSETFLPAVVPLQILLLGIVALSLSRVLANDIAGRGRPIINTYVSVCTLVTNVMLNILWIPRHGIAGAAWASTVSYGVALLARLFFYCRLSGNSWTKVLLPQPGDWAIYRRTGLALGRWLRAKIRALL